MIRFKDTVTTDVLIVGGGIGGLCAAIASARAGVDTLVVEKSDSRRSGSGATGNDHFLCYYPRAHGNDITPILQETFQSQIGGFHDPEMTLRFLRESIAMADRWLEWGINMRPFGSDYEFMGHAFPGRPRIWLKYDGHNQKYVLTSQARKAGAKILNHSPIVDLVTVDGKIAGALALDVSGEEPFFRLIRAKKVILATGTANRLYPAAGTPGSPFNTAFCPACTGAAQAQAWRVGAKMVNMEMPNRHAGPKFFARAGKSTWIGVYRYSDGRLLGPFVEQATRYIGDITCDVWNTAYTDVLHNGTGPAYIDCTGISSDDLDFMKQGMVSEGLTTVVDYMKRSGLDVTKHAFEFMQYEPHLIGRGLEVDINGESSIPGLYGTGDMVGNFRADISGAAVYGWICGGHAASTVRGCAHRNVEGSPWVQERAELYSSLLKRKNGGTWKEANLGLQQIMASYAAAGPYNVRSESLLKAGLKYLGDLRADAASSVSVENAHELMRAVEAFDLMDNGEIVMHAARERRESRGMHLRSDYTFTNPLLNNKFLQVWQENDAVHTNWRERRGI